MEHPIRHTIQNGKGSYVTFDSVQAFQDFVDAQTKNLSAGNLKVFRSINAYTNKNLKSTTGKTWYGTPAPEDIETLNNHRYFLGMHLLQKVQDEIERTLKHYLKLLEEQVLPKPKVAYNDRGLGVFSFARAAMGLYRLQPADTATAIGTATSQLQIELDTQNKTTAVKSVYAYFKDRKSSYPALRVYVLSGANANVDGDALLYVGLACAVLVAFMELRGVAVEVNALIGSSFDGKMSMSVVRVKRFQDRLDKNQLLLMTSDPRYFRYRGFKAIIAISDYLGYQTPPSLGRITPEIGKQFVSTITDSTTFNAVFEQSYAKDTAVREVADIITRYTQRSP